MKEWNLHEIALHFACQWFWIESDSELISDSENDE